MSPSEIKSLLIRLVEDDVRLPVMLWGPPGVGKSSIVAQIAEQQDMEFIDLRLSQLAPTDLRGLPVPKDGKARWYPPEFLPTNGRGILFLDEINMAPPAIQGIAQQLVLDRKVGKYWLPEGWQVWAAGNRKEDAAAVFAMPAPLANRFLHLEIQPDFESFRSWAVRQDFHEQIIAFLAFRPELLHKMDANSSAWPSPRSWNMANTLHEARLSIESAVGQAVAGEFKAYIRVYRSMPNLDSILSGANTSQKFPKDPSTKFATTVGLSMRAIKPEEIQQGFRWLIDSAGAEWCQLYLHNVADRAESANQLGQLAIILKQEPRMMKFLTSFKRSLGLAGAKQKNPRETEELKAA